MSLINEALKRTRDASCGMPVPSAIRVPAYRIDSGRRHRPGNVSVPTVVVGLVILVSLGLGVFLAWRVPARPTPAAAQPASSPSVSVAQPSAVAPAPQPVAATPAAVESALPSPARIKADEDALVDKLMVRIKTEQASQPVTPPPAPDLPKLVLQGITHGGEASEAMINGYTVRIGDEVDGGRVVAIEPQWVKLRFGEREILLRLR